MRLKVGSKIYPPLALDSVNLRDVILFDSEVRDLRADLKWTWADVERVTGELDALSSADADRHPDKYFYFATLIWAVRRLNGEAVTFSEAVDVNLSEVDLLEDPEDRKPGKSTGAKRPRKASVPAVLQAAPSEDLTTPPPEDSASESIPA